MVGRIFKSDTSPYWLAEAPQVGAFTQGYTREEAYEMLIDAIQELVNVDGFSVTLSPLSGDDVEIAANYPDVLAAYVEKYGRLTMTKDDGDDEED